MAFYRKVALLFAVVCVIGLSMFCFADPSVEAVVPVENVEAVSVIHEEQAVPIVVEDSAESVQQEVLSPLKRMLGGSNSSENSESSEDSSEFGTSEEYDSEDEYESEDSSEYGTSEKYDSDEYETENEERTTAFDDEYVFGYASEKYAEDATAEYETERTYEQ